MKRLNSKVSDLTLDSDRIYRDVRDRDARFRVVNAELERLKSESQKAVAAATDELRRTLCVAAGSEREPLG